MIVSEFIVNNGKRKKCLTKQFLNNRNKSDNIELFKIKFVVK